MENNKNEQPIEIMVEQVKMPTFGEYCKMNEAALAAQSTRQINEGEKSAMDLYSEMVNILGEIRGKFDEAAFKKTGMMASLMALNKMILENPEVGAQPEDSDKKKDKKSQAQSQPQMTQPQLSLDIQPAQPAKSQAQKSQPATQQPIQPIPGQETDEK